MPDTQPRVSVVVSCYNYGAFLAGAVESALKQTWQNIEILIVDDGSTDDTEQVAARLVAADPRVSYLRQTNQGQASAKNLGISKGSAPFVAFLDADDRWRPDKLERQIPLFSDSRVGVVFSRMRPVDAEGKPLSKQDVNSLRMPRRGQVTDALFIDNFIPFSSAVVRRAVFDRVGAMDSALSMGIDWDLWLRASIHFHFDFVAGPLLDYRVGHSGQMSHRQEERFGWADRIMSQFLERNPGAVSRSALILAWGHTFSSRGLYFRERDLSRSTSNYWRSIQAMPLQLDAYRGLLGNAVAGVRKAFTRSGRGGR